MNNAPDNYDNADREDEKRPSFAINMQELQRRREAGELEKTDFNFVQWHIMNPNKPLEKADLGRQALILEAEEFDKLGVLEIKLPNGKTCLLDYDDHNDGLVIFPENLG